MKLTELYIKNFKSIKDCKLLFSENMHCLIGQNESGKSNILKAMQYLDYSNNSLTTDLVNETLDNQENTYPEITGIFEFDEIEKSKILEATIQLKDTIIPGYNKISILINGPNKENVTATLIGASKSQDLKSILTEVEYLHALDIIAYQIPYFEYYQNEDFSITQLNINKLIDEPESPEIQSFKKLLELGGMKDFSIFRSNDVGRINKIKQKTKVKVNEILNSYYQQNSNLKIDLQTNNDVLTLHFDESPIYNEFKDRSTGFQYFFSFLINKIHSEKIRNYKTVYLLDEPALSLHPKGQKDFLKLLEDLALDCQIVYTTHSPFSINRLKPQRVLCVENSIETGTVIKSKAYSNNWKPLRTSLGIDISDSFYYADKTLLVEGPEDRLYLSLMIQYFVDKDQISLNSDLFSIVESGGEGNLPAMAQILQEEGRPIVILMDSDSSSTYNRLVKKSEKSGGKGSMTVNKIDDFKNEAISIEDLLDMDIYRKAIFNTIASLIKEKQIGIKENSKNALGDLAQISSPGAYNKFKEHFNTNYEKIGEQGKIDNVPISKLAIAHEYDKIVKSEKLKMSVEIESIQLNMITTVLKQLGLL